MLNIHPGLLPSFGGKGYYGERVHQAVLQSGARYVRGKPGAKTYHASNLPAPCVHVLQGALCTLAASFCALLLVMVAAATDAGVCAAGILARPSIL